MDTNPKSCDPRIRAAEKMLTAITECEEACGDFAGQIQITSPHLASVLLLLGGSYGKRGDGSVFVRPRGREIEVLVMEEAARELPDLERLITAVSDAMTLGAKASDGRAGEDDAKAAWVEVYKIKTEILMEVQR